ncbi:hypothetical protein VOLCADRAFT_92454 [Volvox carteri f. nagariensis]|uniref:Uncharacterized protein n=1 Tax=Volvox carteri f. nagariensis TaxID=3068 RepID=D8TZP9_VOLCA|nr:uncharacterized protein VOLCADRAFT_92454 [Volvox carteri f. nagariensis]EFJ46962.1 hypothetical protein VOLCADRAFT_92454 [Volvox carteri f. nagariensis]|eukprot:XP_002951857.1 hypothetical protein VOLCADRAFT_92454 [Volvox carteri f. nagariensis]
MVTIRQALLSVRGEDAGSISPTVAALSDLGFDVDAEVGDAFLLLNAEQAAGLTVRQQLALKAAIQGIHAWIHKRRAHYLISTLLTINNLYITFSNVCCLVLFWDGLSGHPTEIERYAKTLSGGPDGNGKGKTGNPTISGRSCPTLVATPAVALAPSFCSKLQSARLLTAAVTPSECSSKGHSWLLVDDPTLTKSAGASLLGTAQPGKIRPCCAKPKIAELPCAYQCGDSRTSETRWADSRVVAALHTSIPRDLYL